MNRSRISTRDVCAWLIHNRRFLIWWRQLCSATEATQIQSLCPHPATFFRTFPLSINACSACPGRRIIDADTLTSIVYRSAVSRHPCTRDHSFHFIFSSLLIPCKDCSTAAQDDIIRVKRACVPRVCLDICGCGFCILAQRRPDVVPTAHTIVLTYIPYII